MWKTTIILLQLNILLGKFVYLPDLTLACTTPLNTTEDQVYNCMAIYRPSMVMRPAVPHIQWWLRKGDKEHRPLIWHPNSKPWTVLPPTLHNPKHPVLMSRCQVHQVTLRCPWSMYWQVRAVLVEGEGTIQYLADALILWLICVYV